MYEKAGVSGPTEFGELPLSDKLYWNAWLNEHARRTKKRNDEIEAQAPD